MDLQHFNSDAKKELVGRVSEHVFSDYLNFSESRREQLLEEMIYWEKKRIEKIERSKKRIFFWDHFQQVYLKADLTEREALLKKSIEIYTQQVVGNFSPFFYTLATKAIPPFLSLLLNALSLKRLFSIKRSFVNENLLISGNLSLIRNLSERGTLVFTPTHASHLDSILLGCALHLSNLPPVMYGAGLNLFKNRLIGFFMNRLGAYKVDRLRIHQIYKDVLKEFATSSLEMGFHNLFFPGGTRSRSGAIEKRLKMGLLGTTLKAYIRNLKAKKPYPNIYIVPVNITSHLTLEAETLIEDFLAASGKSRFIIEDDEFSRMNRIYQYIKNHMNLSSKTFIHFGNPLDPFGNTINNQGGSVDHHDRPVDISRYVIKNGEIANDDERDRNYTSELADALIDVFHRNNRVMSTHLVSFALYEMVARTHLDKNIYQLLRSHEYETPIELVDLYKALDRIIPLLMQLSEQKRIVYGETLKTKDVQDIVNEALRIFSVYHTRKTIYREGDKIYIGDLLLLYYYHNRLIGYNLEDMVAKKV